MFVEKVYDVVGLYFNPPKGAVVLSVDEKSQFQAVDRSQPVIPGMPERRTHDYIRNGLTTLFAAFDVATGEVITSLHRRHRAAKFKKFLIEIEKEVPGHLQIHPIRDNYGTHTRRPPSRHGWPNTPDFTCTSPPPVRPGSPQVERWFGFLADQKIRRGSHKSVRSLEADIRAWSRSGTRTQHHSPEPSRPRRSSTPSPAFANGSPAQDTKGCCRRVGVGRPMWCLTCWFSLSW
ncbi:MULTISPECIES: transposase [unclassified Streptomyces]|uniref:transposase n=1 Tax=unclassified Streptomyces TaxID=2593676 RepID=UPI0036EF0156